MKIYVDMDDVLCETAAALCEIAAAEFSRKKRYEDIREFDLQKTFSFTDGEMKRFRELSHRPEVLASFAQTPDAVSSVRILVSRGHSVDIVTGRPASSHIGTKAWLEAAGLGDLPVTYMDKYNRAAEFTRSMDDPQVFSREEVACRSYDFAIDDSPAALEILAGWRNTRVLIFDRPWNKSFAPKRNMRRVSGWNDILAQIKEA